MTAPTGGREQVSLRTFTSWRSAAVRALSGTVLEIGAGSGANFADLSPGVRWIGLEPDPRARSRLARRAQAAGRTADVLGTGAEDIPLPAGSVDAVLSTLVLCSVTDPAAALAEVRRVLRPGGRAVFVDHVAAEAGTAGRRFQEAATPVARRLLRNCHWDREITREIRDAGFETVALREVAVSAAPFLPHIPAAIHEVAAPR